MSASKTNWTRDADGKPIIWIRPPYYVNGVLNLVLPGEDMVSINELAKRRNEYLLQQRKRMAQKEAPAEVRGKAARQGNLL